MVIGPTTVPLRHWNVPSVATAPESFGAVPSSPISLDLVPSVESSSCRIAPRCSVVLPMSLSTEPLATWTMPFVGVFVLPVGVKGSLIVVSAWKSDVVGVPPAEESPMSMSREPDTTVIFPPDRFTRGSRSMRSCPDPAKVSLAPTASVPVALLSSTPVAPAAPVTIGPGFAG
jgi:hypothetical protein